MAFFVLTYRESQPDRLDGVLGRITENLADPNSAHPGQRTTRLFQRLGQPTHLLSVSEWTDERSFMEFLGSTHVAVTDTLNGARPRSHRSSRSSATNTWHAERSSDRA